MKTPIKLIYILGSGHSGSTLLDLILGSHSRVESVGEILHYAKYFGKDSDFPYKRRGCSCGLKVDKCEYWGKVNKGIEESLGTTDITLRAKSQSEFDISNYAVFSSVLSVAGKEFICDSSKNRFRLLQLLRSACFNTYIVHLIRDGRSVQYSYQKRRGHYSLSEVFRWGRANLGSFFMFRSLSQYQVVRYEDLVAHPSLTVSKIMHELGLEYEPEQLNSWSKITHHNLGGHGVRGRKNQQIYSDKDYITKMTRSEWLIGTALALPGLVFWGYPLFKNGMLKMHQASS